MKRLLAPLAVALLAAALTVPTASPALAAPRTFTWSGGGLTNGWGDADNWAGKEAPPTSGDTIVDLSAAGATTITGASGQISELRATGGTIVEGSGLTITRRIEAVCVRLSFDNLIVTGGGDIAGGAIYGSMTNQGNITQRPVRTQECLNSDGGMKTPSTLISSAAVLTNAGTWRANGAWLLGSNCCGTPTSSRVVNEPTGRFVGLEPGGFAISNLEFQNAGRLEGTVTLDNSHTVLEGGTQVSSRRGVAPGARVTLRGGETTVEQTFTIGRGGVLRLADENARLVGPGKIETPALPSDRPPGTLRFEGGQVLGFIETGNRLRVEKAGARKLFVRTLGGVPGLLLVKGPAALSGAGPLSIDALAAASFQGAVTVTGAVTVAGTSCCRETEIPLFDVGGTMTLAGGASLAVESARLGLEGAIAGAGRLTLKGGRHYVGNGARLATQTVLDANAFVALPNGRVVVDAPVEQRFADLRAPSGLTRQTLLEGSGSWTWRRGDIQGAVALAIPLVLPATGTERALEGRLELRAASRIGGGLTLYLRSRLTVEGELTLVDAAIDAPGSPAARVRVAPGGTLLVRGSLPSGIHGATVSIDGTLDLRSAGLDLGDGTLHSEQGDVRLRGQSLTARKVTIQSQASLAGPGSVFGDVVAGGTVSMAARGALEVHGDWRSLPRLRLGLTAAGDLRDSLRVQGHVDLGGRLTVLGFTRPSGTPTVLVSALTRGGVFDAVTGMPPQTAVDYTNRSVVLKRLA
ncbi:MAG: hypothetical protein FJW79_02500 [Actinobacteria bacterium]|nr:hypothetical protein [Actinomycetota bacterium]